MIVFDILDAKCLAEQNNGLYISAENQEDLMSLQKIRRTSLLP
jgi:hypothetical protein